MDGSFMDGSFMDGSFMDGSFMDGLCLHLGSGGAGYGMMVWR